MKQLLYYAIAFCLCTSSISLQSMNSSINLKANAPRRFQSEEFDPIHDINNRKKEINKLIAYLNTSDTITLYTTLKSFPQKQTSSPVEALQIKLYQHNTDEISYTRRIHNNPSNLTIAHKILELTRIQRKELSKIKNIKNNSSIDIVQELTDTKGMIRCILNYYVQIKKAPILKDNTKLQLEKNKIVAPRQNKDIQLLYQASIDAKVLALQMSLCARLLELKEFLDNTEEDFKITGYSPTQINNTKAKVQRRINILLQDISGSCKTLDVHLGTT